MVALVFEAYGAFCLFSLIAFLVWACAAKLRPDLDEDIDELEKLKKLVSSEQSRDALPIEPPIIEEPFWPPPRPLTQSKRPIRRRPHLFNTRKPRTT
jgi:hypothetical protein